MLTEIHIKNYKSITDLTLQLGQTNVLIGENGAGKSNILEAIALAGAASANKLDHEFLSSRGIRVTEPKYMRAAFKGFDDNAPIEVSAESENSSKINFIISNDNKPYSAWQHIEEMTARDGGPMPTDLIQWAKQYVSSPGKDKKKRLEDLTSFMEILKVAIKSEDKEHDLREIFNRNPKNKSNKLLKTFVEESEKINELKPHLSNFIVFSPENTSLKTFEKEGQIRPLGINGEGLLRLLRVVSNIDDQDDINQIKENLRLLGWFSDFTIQKKSNELEMLVKDRFLDEERCTFDQNSTNEGFLFLAFYFALFTVSVTPDFFAIDNIDASLNPKLCKKMLELLHASGKRNNKQAILTTHNPSILDGLDIFDDKQRLFVIERNEKGHTTCRRILPPAEMTREQWQEQYYGMKLSEIWLSGAIGGLPEGF